MAPRRDRPRTVGVNDDSLDSAVLRFAGGADVVDYTGPIAAIGHERDLAG
jgi:hypothetical protein